MSSLFIRLTLCGILLSPAPMTVQAAPVQTATARASGNLNWPGKTQTDVTHYGVPPSPYGQVGDFFKTELNWPAKPARNPAPAAVSDTRPERYVSAPAEPYLYRPATYSPVPQVASRVSPAAPLASLVTPPPLPAPQPRLTPEQMRALEAPAPRAPRAEVKPAPKPVTMAPIPKPAPPVAEAKPAQPAPVATAPALSAQPAAPDTDAYQIPRTSKYYRGAQTDTAPQATPGVASGVGFTPGQTITDPATQSPRFYSLHREYGLSPDAIPLPSEDTATYPAPRDTTQGQNDLPVAKESPK